VGCALLVFSKGEGWDEALYSSFLEIPITINIYDKRGLCLDGLLFWRRACPDKNRDREDASIFQTKNLHLTEYPKSVL
jgi:hypothetical protein